MPQPFNISYDAADGWKCDPPKQKIDGPEAEFDVDCQPSKIGCRVCFANTTVFGPPSYRDLLRGKNSLPFTGNSGNKTTFNIQDYGADCPQGPQPLADPYDVIIGSGFPGQGKTPSGHKK